jgi:hypothetical protein
MNNKRLAREMAEARKNSSLYQAVYNLRELLRNTEEVRLWIDKVGEYRITHYGNVIGHSTNLLSAIEQAYHTTKVHYE